MSTHLVRGVVRAEWIKLVSTKQLQRYTALAVGLSVLITVLLGAAMGQYNSTCSQPGRSCREGLMAMDDTIATAGIIGDGTPGAGLIVVMLLGATCVLVEYRYGTLATAYFATPARGLVIGVKAAVAFAVGLVSTLLAGLLSALAFKVVASSAAHDVQPWSANAGGLYLRTALVVALASAAAVGLAGAIRHTAGVISVVLLWPLLLEPLLPSLLPTYGERAAGLMPFVNARRFIGLDTSGDFFWGPGWSGLYFAALALAAVAGGLVLVRATDLRQPA
ncbi:hypothetical protein PZ938_04895 [Luteipulveratus sp. YIM 133132]|uniref:hypothetical protein n=1 Tax=Luteipulveratus flavus TaxID=3031728 RepID=UPI0023AEE9D2|nr:hypothetical protein [Luteipulveratus sp. YIM 133132]MDE9364935.1 hypothetical protein [Luteipulveratus sp. YIM 133132]